MPNTISSWPDRLIRTCWPTERRCKWPSIVPNPKVAQQAPRTKAAVQSFWPPSKNTVVVLTSLSNSETVAGLSRALFFYTVIYEPVEDGGFYAHIPALDVTTEGETLAEAKEMARDAIENVLACRRELNLPMPEEAGCETIEAGA